MQKFEFGSNEWVEEIRRQLEEGLAGEDLTGIEFSLSEEYTDAPEHLLDDGKPTIGFHLRITGGKVLVERQPLDEADMRVIVDYQSILPGARRTHGPDGAGSPENQQLVAELTAAGKLQVTRSCEMPDVMAKVNLHDRMAVRTA